MTGFAGQSVGEASNPGPQLRKPTANVTSLLPHLPYVTSLDCDILALQEVRLTIDGQVMIQEYLRECGWTSLWGKPQPVRPGTRLSVLDAKQGRVGNCVRSGHHISPTPRSTLGEELYQTGRWQSAVVRVSGSNTQVHGFPRATESGEAMEHNQAFLNNVFLEARSLGDVPVVVCGDFNVKVENSSVSD